MKTIHLKQLALILCLSLTLCDAVTAQTSTTSNASPTSNDAGSSHFKLFAGVTHQEELPQAHEVLQPHLARQQMGTGSASGPINGVVSASTIPSSLTAALAAQKAAAAIPQPTSTLSAKASTQAYSPAFGVARVTAPRQQEVQRPAEHYTVEWFMIPSWMAGVWMKSGDMTTQVTDLRTGASSKVNEWTENRLESSWGHQQDSQGNYWHVNILPAERDGNSAGKLVRFLTVNQRCESSTPQQLITRTHYVVSESNPWNKQVFDTFQQESLNHYALEKQNQLLNSSSNRVFSYQGVPVRDGHLVSEFQKIGQFTPTANLNGIDLRASLNDYLATHSMGHLRK